MVIFFLLNYLLRSTTALACFALMSSHFINDDSRYILIDEEIKFTVSVKNINNLRPEYIAILNKFKLKPESQLVLNRIFVSEIGENATLREVCRPFVPFGRIVGFKMFRNSERPYLSYAFITFDNSLSAFEVLRMSQSVFEVNGRFVRVKPAMETPRTGKNAVATDA